jgi:hypothetical protein
MDGLQMGIVNYNIWHNYEIWVYHNLWHMFWVHICQAASLGCCGCPAVPLPLPRLWTKGFEYRRACSLGSSTGGSMSGHGDFSRDFIRSSCDFMWIFMDKFMIYVNLIWFYVIFTGFTISQLVDLTVCAWEPPIFREKYSLNSLPTPVWRRLC